MDLASENWVEIYTFTQSVTGTPSQSNRIPRLYFPVQFLNDYFKIYVQSFDSPITWDFAGFLSLYTGSISTTQPTWIKSQKIYLNLQMICHFPEISLTSTSHLEYACPYWFPNVSLTVYQYQETI